MEEEEGVLRTARIMRQQTTITIPILCTEALSEKTSLLTQVVQDSRLSSGVNQFQTAPGFCIIIPLI